MLRIGSFCFDTRVVLAPMVGVTDMPYRSVCARHGTRLAIGEMVAADARLWGARRTQLRLRHPSEQLPRWVQIVGNDPQTMAEGARRQADRGAQIIDINMGCPARKVCSRAAGSALLRDERLVAAILTAVVESVPDVPVTLKMRTGWSPAERNGVRIARIAEDCGIRLLSVHGRTRACRFAGRAEYDTIRDIVRTVRLPVIANGDIASAAQAGAVLAHTGASAVMVGRAAQGRPWLCGAIDAALAGQPAVPSPDATELAAILIEHLAMLHEFYGDASGVRIARKHAGWYVAVHGGDRAFLHEFNRLESASAQLAVVRERFALAIDNGAKAA